MNALETALADASKDASKEFRFYEVLLEANVYFIPHGRTPETIDGAAVEGQAISIRNVDLGDGKPYAPFFSSLEALRAVLTEEAHYVELKGRDFLEFIKGNEAVLNPGFEYGKVLLRQEIVDILSGDIFRKRSQITIEKDTRIQIGRPKSFPADLVASLSDLYRGIPEMKAAYLAWVKLDGPEEKPHLMIMLDADRTDRDLVAASGEVVNRWLAGRKEVVDFITGTGDGLSETVRAAGTRFYRKKRFLLF